MFIVKISEINDKEDIILQKSFDTERKMNKFLYELKGIKLEYDIEKRTSCPIS